MRSALTQFFLQCLRSLTIFRLLFLFVAGGFWGGAVFAQTFPTHQSITQTVNTGTIRIYDGILDTLGETAGDGIFYPVANKTCLTIPSVQNGAPFSIDVWIPRPVVTGNAEAGGTDSCWGSSNVRWTFPKDPELSAEWSVYSVEKVSGVGNTAWDKVTLHLTGYVPQDMVNARLGGDFRAYWTAAQAGGSSVKGDTLCGFRIFIPIRPSLRAPDTIMLDNSVICHGSTNIFKVRFKNTTDTAYVSTLLDIRALFHWYLISEDEDGKKQYTPWKVPENYPTTKDSTLTVTNFDAVKYIGIAVNRAICGSFDQTSTNTAPLKEWLFNDDEIFTNPPLDTISNPREDTLYRLIWWNEDPELIGTPEEGNPKNKWIATDSDLSCVNYGKKMTRIDRLHNANDGGVGAIDSNTQKKVPSFFPTEREKMAQVADGYLFFQVGTYADTMLRYVWTYDTNLVERIYPDATWFGNGVSAADIHGLSTNRWNSLMNKNEAEDGEWRDDIRNWGAPNADNFYPGDSTYRAMFRVKTMTELDRAASLGGPDGGRIVIRVQAFCLLCKDGTGQPFQSKKMERDLGIPWDTTKPFSDFTLTKHASDVYADAASVMDTSCYRTTAYFKIAAGSDIGAVTNGWTANYLKETYNITNFRSHTNGTVDNYVIGGAFPNCVIELEANTTALLVANSPVRPYYMTVSGSNACFSRKPPTLNTSANAAPTMTIWGGLVDSLQSVPPRVEWENKTTHQRDSAWFQLATLRIRKPARAPRIIDPLGVPGGIPKDTLGPTDTIFLCENLVDSVGGALAVNNGVTYFLANHHDKLSTTYVQGARIYGDATTPINGQIHGWSVPNGEDGNPEKISLQVLGRDSNTTRIGLFLIESEGKYDGPKEGILSFAAQDVCGKGDSATVAFIVMDTVSLASPPTWGLSDESWTEGTAGDLALFADTMPCEATEIFFRTSGEDRPSRKQGIQWLYPASWSGVTSPSGTEGEYEMLRMTYGPDTGTVRINMKNQCGGSVPVETPMIRPIGYYRAHWMEPLFDTVCEDAIYTYKLEQEDPDKMLDLQIRFPNDWEVIGSNRGNYEAPYKPTDSLPKILWDALGNPEPMFKTRTGKESGTIAVRWMVEACDTGNIRPARWDMTSVFTHTYPQTPLIQGTWPDTICARNDTVWFSVKPQTVDSLQENTYQWQFPPTWRPLYDRSTAKRDSVFVIAGSFQSTDSIRVWALSAAATCDPDRRSEPLVRAITVWDTIVFDESLIQDVVTKTQFALKLCVGSTMMLKLLEPPTTDSVKWFWNGGQSYADETDPTDARMLNYWYTNQERLPDTLEIRTKSANPPSITLPIQVAMYNRCGTSRSPEYRIDTTAAMDENYILKLDADRFAAELCAGSDTLYWVDTSSTADPDGVLRSVAKYVWFYPAGPAGGDTVHSSEPFIRIKPTALGAVSVYAINGCSSTKRSDDPDPANGNTQTEHFITALKEAPRRPHAVDFAESATMGDAVVYDTLCRYGTQSWGAIRYDKWTVGKDPADDFTLSFKWFKMAGDTTGDLLVPFGMNITDSMRIVSPNASITRKRTLIGVSGVREGCEVNGDTLQIWLTTADTVAAAELDEIGVWTGGSFVRIEDFPKPCAHSIVAFGVKNDSALSYRWILPEGYQYYNTVDTTGGRIEVIVGAKQARIGVVSTVEGYCNYENQEVLFSDTIKPVPAPVIEEFLAIPDSICEADTFVFRVRSTGPSMLKATQAYHWVFPEGWLPRDTVTTVDSIRMPIGSGSGKIYVSGIDTCTPCNNTSGICANEGEPLIDSVFVWKTPSYLVEGDLMPCKGDTVVYALHPSDRWVWMENKDFSIEKIPNPYDVRTEIFEIADDTAMIVYRGDNGSGVRFVFDSVRHQRCSTIASISIETRIRSQMPLEIDRLEGPDTVCQGSTQVFVATRRTNLVTDFVWELPQSWAADTSRSRSADGNHDTLRIGNFPSLPAIEDVLGTLTVKGKDACFVGDNPDNGDVVQTKTVLIDTIPLPSPILDALAGDVRFTQGPCQDQHLALYMPLSGRYDSVIWFWDGGQVVDPNTDSIGEHGWRFHDSTMLPDTLSLIVPADNKKPLTIGIQVRNSSCGISQRYSFTLTPSASVVEKPTFKTPQGDTSVCDNENFAFELNTPGDDAVDFYWQYSWDSKADTIGLTNTRLVPDASDLRVWVTPANGCGAKTELNSDTIHINEVLRKPNRPRFLLDEENFLTDAKVFDTACLRRDHTLTVSKAEADDFEIIYRWFLLEGDAASPLDGGAVEKPETDSTLTLLADLVSTDFKNVPIGVTATRKGCTLPGDTLRIELNQIDTIPVSYLGKITADSVLPNGEYCANEEIQVGVQYDFAPAYQWKLPEGWSFVGDSTLDIILIKVGTQNGSVEVQPITDKEMKVCPYFSATPMISESLLKIHQAPELDSFYFLEDSTCSEAAIIIAAGYYEIIRTTDIGITSIARPLAGAHPDLTATEQVDIEVENFGDVDVDSFGVVVEVDGMEAFRETVKSPITAGITQIVSLGQKLDLSEEKSYHIRIYTVLPEDTESANDTLSITVEHTAESEPEGFYDATISNISRSGIFPAFSDKEAITFTIRNNGDFPLDTMAVKLEVNNVVISTNTLILPSEPIEQGESRSFPFPDSVDLATKQIYRVRVWVVIGDENPANDTLEIKWINGRDVEIAELISPDPDADLNVATPIIVKVKNIGSENIPAGDLLLTCSLPDISPLSSGEMLQAGDSTVFTIGNTDPLNLTDFRVSVSVANDLDPTNDGFIWYYVPEEEPEESTKTALAKAQNAPATPKPLKPSLSTTKTIHAYRYIIEQFRIDSEVIDTIDIVQDSVKYHYKVPDLRYNKVRISAIAIDSSCSEALYSEPIVDSFVIFNTPRVWIEGDELPCRDSIETYRVVASDHHVSYDPWGSGTATVSVVEGGFSVDYSTGDTARMELRNIRHAYCSTSGNDTVFILVADTTPTILFQVEGDTVVCMGDEVKVFAKETGGATFKVEFLWNQPSYAENTSEWQLQSSTEDGDSVVYKAPEFSGSPSRIDTLRVFARGGCGTSNTPQLFPVRIDAPPVFNNLVPEVVYAPMNTELTPNFVCEDSTLTVFIDTIGTGYAISEIRWRYPGADDLAGDTSVTFAAPRDSFFVQARFRVEGFCGLSRFGEVSTVRINVYPQPTLPASLQQYPCIDLEMGFSLPYDKWTDSIVWQSVGTIPPFDTLTTTRTPHDSVFFQNVGAAPFQMIATAVNLCGTRPGTITITPSNAPDQFAINAMSMFDDPTQIRYCFGDTITAWVEIPLSHIQERPAYQWSFLTLSDEESDWKLVDYDSIDEAQQHARIRFIPGRDTVNISVVANHCGISDPAEVNNKMAVIIRLNAAASSDVANYGQTGIFLYVAPDSVGYESIDPLAPAAGNIDGFNFLWTPANRFEADPEDTARLIWPYLGRETFPVTAVENDISLPRRCSTTDTVFILVQNAYKVAVKYPDSVCEKASFPLAASATGGEPTYYGQTWFRKNTQSGLYEPFTTLVDPQDVAWANPGEYMHYRIVGTDSVYSQPGETTKEAVYDTINFSLKVLPQISVQIDSMQVVQIIDKVVEDKAVALEFELPDQSKPVKLGDRVRFFGKVDGKGRSENLKYFYSWYTEELVDDAELDGDYAGFLQNDTVVGVTGLIFFPQSFYFYAADTTAWGCESQMQVFVPVQEITGNPKDDFGTIPGGISPHNADGNNDIFMKAADEITILNRWGMIVFESKDGEGWDGRDQKTKRLVERGDYFYIITIYDPADNNKKSVKTGVVSVF